jgi:5,10-methylenetetrahydromethanopterin reductase
MRLGLAVSGRRPAREAVELAGLAEDLAFSEVWLTEDYCERGAFSVAGAIAASTSVIEVGIGVVNPWTRHPMLVAMEAAALAEVAPRRVTIGLGASNARWMREQLGIAFERPLEALEDAVAVVRAALTDGRVSIPDGRFPTEAALAFTPPGPIPVVLGVKGPRALELAGRIGDGVVLSVLSAPAYVAWARRLASTVPVSGYVAFSCDDDHEAARERLRGFVATYLGVHGEHPITGVAGITPDRAAAFRQGWRSGEARTDLVTDADLDTLVVAGDPDHCAGVLRRFAEAGLGTAIVHDRGEQDMAAFLRRVHEVAGRSGVVGR